MKPFRTILMAACVALACAATASAQTVVRLTGSTAFRAATHTAITHIFASGFTYAYTGGTFTSASQAIFTGTVGGNSVIIKTSWSGSVAGSQTVSKSLNVNFLPNSTPQSTGGTANATVGTEAAVPDVGMADSFQSSTPFTSPVLVDTLVGIQPFKWLASNGAPAGLNNMNPQLAQALFGNGSLAIALFTGQSSDRTTLVHSTYGDAINGGQPLPVQVYATGRDPDSGSRLTTFAESGIGVNSQVVQYQPTISGGAVTNQVPWPLDTVNGITYPVGDAGYNSGGLLATTLTATTLTGLGGYYVSYLSTGDSPAAIAGGAKELTYNGVPFSLTAVQEGQYTFWCYEHLTYRSAFAGIGKITADTLANQIISVDSPVLLSNMQVSRATDGGIVTPLY